MVLKFWKSVENTLTKIYYIISVNAGPAEQNVNRTQCIALSRYIFLSLPLKELFSEKVLKLLKYFSDTLCK